MMDENDSGVRDFIFAFMSDTREDLREVRVDLKELRATVEAISRAVATKQATSDSHWGVAQWVVALLASSVAGAAASAIIK
jgi:hypothetical protein